MERALQVFERLKGPVVPVNVCFASDDSVDYKAVKRYVGWLSEQKVPVILLTMGSSELYNLTSEEIWKLTAEVAEGVGGRSLFIASTGFWPSAESGEFLKHCDRVGVDAVKVQISTWMQPTQEVILGYFDLIQEASDIPLLSWSADPPIPVDVVAQLAQRPQLVGMKNDGHPFYDYYELIRATMGKNYGVISGGQMRNFMFGYPIGSPAYLCPIAPFRPDIALEFYGALADGRNDKAWNVVFNYEEPWMREAGKLDWLQSIKSALRLYGLYPNNRPRSPKPSHTPEQMAQVKDVLQKVFGTIEAVSL